MSTAIIFRENPLRWKTTWDAVWVLPILLKASRLIWAVFPKV